MISISLPLRSTNWNTISFASTLYLRPILDLLLAKIPRELHPEIRLGLQEALVNAVKHGNKLDPSKTIVVQFSAEKNEYCWVISDQGKGFASYCQCPLTGRELPLEEAENGRGLCMLHQIFDRVNWNRQGTKVRLSKQVKKFRQKQPVLS